MTEIWAFFNWVSDNQAKNGHTVSQSKYVACRMIHDDLNALLKRNFDDTFHGSAVQEFPFAFQRLVAPVSFNWMF